MANNNNIYNAALSGAAAGVASRWLTSSDQASYAAQAALINSFAIALDAAIPIQVDGGSRGQCAVISEICAAFWSGRFIPPSTNFASAVGPLVALYQTIATNIQPDTGGGGGTIPPFDNYLYVNLTAPAGGDGSLAKPFQTMQEAVDVAVDGGTIFVAPGDYTTQGQFSWGGDFPGSSDKNLSFMGTTPFNQSTAPVCKGLFPNPQPSTPFTMALQFTNMNFHPTGTRPINYFLVNCNCAPQGADQSNYNIQGNNEYNNFAGDHPGAIGSLTGHDMIVSSPEIHGLSDLWNCTINGTITFPNVGSNPSTWQSCRLSSGFSLTTSAQALQLYNCTFNGPGTFTGQIITDESTYHNGIYWGVQFPPQTIIVGLGQPVQPGFVAAGTPDSGSGSAVTLHPSIPHTITGDRLFMVTQELGAPGVANPANIPAGWQVVDAHILVPGTNSGLMVISRDAPAVNDEFGATVAMTWPPGSAVNLAQIFTMRNCVQTAVCWESASTSTNTVGVAHGPTQPGAQGRLGVAVFGTNELAVATAITGAVDGIWVDRMQSQAGLGSSVDVQTAGVSAVGGVSGGSMQFGSNVAAVAGVAFSLIGLTP